MTKDFILCEIRRVSTTLGHPPGRREFYNATGIREADWHGKFWARWGDALQEAGFQPNERKAAYPDEYRAAKMIALIRDLGHFPTRAEMRLRRREDGSFPDANVYYRLGNRAAIVTFIHDFCNGRLEYADIIAVCDAASDGEQTPEEGASDITLGSIYLIKSGRHYKIGRSNAAGRRQYELAIQLPEKVKTLHVIKTDDPVGIEQYWHKRFADRRKNGEWFELTAEDLRAFRRRKFM